MKASKSLDAASIAGSLTAAQKRLIMASNVKFLKSPGTIFRQARVDRSDLTGLSPMLFEYTGDWWRGYRLSPIGRAVREFLLEPKRNARSEGENTTNTF